MQIQVTQEDIKNGKRNHQTECPIALGIKRQFPKADIHVTALWLKIDVITMKQRTIDLHYDTSTNQGKILWLESKGFFDEKWRTSGEVMDELDKKGISISASKSASKICAMELANLASKGLLGRTKDPSKQQFVYKKPEEGVEFRFTEKASEVKA